MARSVATVREDPDVKAFGWTVLALVFLDELLAMAALGVGGWASPAPWLLVWLLPLAGMATWSLLASPNAPYGGPVVRPVAKVLVFGLACVALVVADHSGWAVVLLVFSVVVNGLALLPSISVLAQDAQIR